MFDIHHLSIRQRLVLTVLAIAVPLNLLIAAVVWRLATSAQEAQLADIKYTVRSITSAVDAHLSKYITLGEALAASPSFFNDDLTEFRIEAGRALPDLSETWLVVVDTQYHQLMNMLQPPGISLPSRRPEGREVQKRAFETGAIQFSHVFVGAVRNDWVTTVEIPVFLRAEPFRILAIVITARGFLRFLNEQGIPAGWFAGIADKNGNFIARVPSHDQFVGQPISEGWRSVLGREGVFEFRSDGHLVKSVNFVSPLSSWTIALAARKDVFEAPLRKTMMWAGLTGATVSALSLLFAIWIGRRITAPMLELEHKAGALVAGEPTQLQTNVPEIERVWTALSNAVAARTQSLQSVRDSEKQLEHDLEAMRKLQNISKLFVREGDLPSVLENILEAAISITDADMGTIQLLDQRSHRLRIIAHRGFERPFLDFWNTVQEGHGSSGMALALRSRVIIEDVTTDPLFVGTPALKIQLQAGVGAVQSTPLISRSDHLLGVFSTHYRVPRRPDDRALRLLDLHARQAADIIERSQADQHVKFLMREVNHRAKNLLTVVQVVARQTAGEYDPKRFAERFSERIAGLAASHDLLVRSAWHGVDITDVVRSQLAHLGHLIGSRITLDGPALILKPSAAQTIGMVIHELATNAGKYGALCDGQGFVRIEWGTTLMKGEPIFRMMWLERGGPPAAPPEKRGFGYLVVVNMAQHDLDADIELEFPASGLVWKLRAPISRVLEQEREEANSISMKEYA